MSRYAMKARPGTQRFQCSHYSHYFHYHYYYYYEKNYYVWDPKVPTEAVQAGLHLHPKP
jgi:hypothetical protein